MFLQLNPPWPSPGASDPLGGVGALPCPSSCGEVAFDAALVKPRAKKPREMAEHPVASAFRALVFPATLQPRLGLLGVESFGDPVCTGRLPAPLTVASLGEGGLEWSGQLAIPLCCCPHAMGFCCATC